MVVGCLLLIQTLIVIDVNGWVKAWVGYHDLYNHHWVPNN